MVTKVFKAKYFPEGDFLGARLGNNPSFVWRSIWSSQQLVNEGYRWRVGNGAEIEVWSSPWLRSMDAPCIQTPKPPTTNVQLVRDLMDTAARTWNAMVINQVFQPSDAHAILRIPFLNMSQPDEILWRYEKSGNYTVKSAYRVYMDRLAGRNELKLAGDWSRIRSLNVPPKVKSCMRRAYRDCLPTRLAIRSRGVGCTPLCVVCNNGNASCWDIFLTCPTSVFCWRKNHLWNAIERIMATAVNFCDFFFQACNQLNENQLSTLSMLIWSTWKMRNQKLWENVIEQPDQILQRAEHLLLAWRCARGQQTDGAVAAPLVGVRRFPPLPSWLKCNVDAAVNAGSNSVSVGCCLRDANGVFVKAMTSWLPATLTPAEAGGCCRQSIGWKSSI